MFCYAVKMDSACQLRLCHALPCYAMLLCPQDLTSLVPWLAQIAIPGIQNCLGVADFADGAETFQIMSIIIVFFLDSLRIFGTKTKLSTLSVSLFFSGLGA